MSLQIANPTVERLAATDRLSAWACAALGLAAILVIPFFLVDVPPVLDYANHLARYVVLARPDDPLLSQMYEIRWAVLPNLGMDAVAVGLLKLFDVHIAGRIVLALSLFVPLLGVIAYSRVVFGRFTWWSLASGLVAFNGIFILGFMNFQASLGLAFLAAALWIALRDRRRDTAAAIAGAASGAVLFFFHIFGLALFALLIGSRELARLYDEWRVGSLRAVNVFRTAVLGVITLTPALVLFSLSPLAGDGGVGPWLGSQKLWHLLTPFMSYSKILTLLTVMILFTMRVLVLRDWRVAGGAPLSFAVLLLAFIAAPSAIGQGTFIDDRCALMMGLLLFAAAKPEVVPRAGVAVGLLIVALIGIRTGAVAITWSEHRADLADLRAAMARVEPGARVLVVHGPELGTPDETKASRTLPGVASLDMHMAALLLIERRAFWPFLFADPSQQPVVVRPAYDQLAHPLGDPIPVSWLSRDLPPQVTQLMARHLPGWRDKFDYVLISGVHGMPKLPTGLKSIHDGSFAALYRIER